MLTKVDEIKAFGLINLYEYTFGLVFGLLINFLYKTIFPFTQNENVFKLAMTLLLLLFPLITLIVYVRQHYINYVPILKNMNLNEDKNFDHPPPIAFGFGFWQTQNQLKLRNDKFTKHLSSIIGI
tara:strand:+ start:2421 stop:2795 length:375 start_codon:yes stop_codon:yes gene_type:complete